MPMHFSKKNPLFKVMDSTLITLPAPPNISSLWNLGSLLSLCLIMQIISGVLLAATYSTSMELSFMQIAKMMEITDKGWLIRYIHSNGASLFFICLYLHIGRGVYYMSFVFKHTWNIGVTIFLLVMATAFLGYVLPINQMSYWGASVITNLFSEVPYIGPSLVNLIWGGATVNNPTIIRFFTFHFLLPFVILALVVIHITLLHMTGSSNPLGVNSTLDKIYFHKYFSTKDMISVMIMSTLFMMLVFYKPMILGDDENFTMANLAVTPLHIQPEWYFLFAYAILRAIPNKLGGVIALLLSITILYIMPLTNTAKFKGFVFYPMNKTLYWAWVSTVILLTWIGMCPVEYPYILTGQVLTIMYFTFFLIYPLLTKFNDNVMMN